MYFLALEISDLEKNTRESAFDPERGHRRRDFFAFVIINDGAIKRFLKGLKKAKKDNNKPNLPS